MGQGFFGYNPPPFVIDAAKKALDQVDCNQYSPTKVRARFICEIVSLLMGGKGRPRLRKALAEAYSPFLGRKVNPETEVTITTGANEG
jgi:kynurenine aminotransferase